MQRRKYLVSYKFYESLAPAHQNAWWLKSNERTQYKQRSFFFHEALSDSVCPCSVCPEPRPMYRFCRRAAEGQMQSNYIFNFAVHWTKRSRATPRLPFQPSQPNTNTSAAAASGRTTKRGINAAKLLWTSGVEEGKELQVAENRSALTIFFFSVAIYSIISIPSNGRVKVIACIFCRAFIFMFIGKENLKLNALVGVWAGIGMVSIFR